MGFDPFLLFSLFYVVIGVRVVFQLIQRWSQVWDRTFTPQDRMLVDQAAFFVLIPISVVLHEFGHAITIWSMGGHVVDYGFYGFAGYVSYDPASFSRAQQVIVASAGSFVNLILIVLALLVVFRSRPSPRAAYCELLLQFAFISGINAFIVYPLLDLASGVQGGDWRQMYDGGVPWLAAIIGVIHIATLVGGYWIYTNPRLKARAAALTDVPPGFERALMGGIRQGDIDTNSLSPAEAALHEAGKRVASGWPLPVRTGIQRFNGGTALTLEWDSHRNPHVVALRTFANGVTDLIWIPVTTMGDTPAPPRALHRWPDRPSVDDMTVGLRIAMETVEGGARQA